MEWIMLVMAVSSLALALIGWALSKTQFAYCLFVDVAFNVSALLAIVTIAIFISRLVEISLC